MKLNKQEHKIFDSFLQEMESFTYTKEEIMKGKSKGASFYVLHTGLKEPLKRAIREANSLIQ